jgi:ribosomal protein S6--L-glutamate ligase
MTLVVGFLLGRPPSPGSVLPAVWELLDRAGARVLVRVRGSDAEELHDADVVGLHGLDGEMLEKARSLEAAGVRCCNSASATAVCRDKSRVLAVLQAAGVRVPRAAVAETWSCVRELAGTRPVVAKRVSGSRGNAVLVSDGGTPEQAPFPGPYLLEERVARRGRDRKVYVVGTRLAGVLRPWPARTLAEKRGRPFALTRAEEVAARAVGAALGLEVYGVDFLDSATGPVAVDVNPFPGFKGVPCANEWLAKHLLAAARRRG